MKKICVTNQKGGSGKTSLAVIMTMAIASKNYKVLAIDTDPQAGLTSFLDPAFDSRNGVYDLLIGDDFSIININRNGIKFDLIPADYRLDRIYASIDHLAFKRALKNFDYDYIVFDTPPTVQGISRAAAIISDMIFIPADMSRSTIKPTLYTIDALEEMEKKGKVILIGYKDPGKESKSFMAELSREFLEKLGERYLGTIPKNITIQKAVADLSYKWSEKNIEKILDPVLNLIGVR